MIYYEFGYISFSKQKKSIEYLAKKFSSNKEIFDLKNDVISKLLNLNTTDSQFLGFLKILREQLELSKKEAQVYYKTEAN